METNIAESVGQNTSNLANKLLDKVDKATLSARELGNQGAVKTQKVLESGIESFNRVQDLGVEKYNQASKQLGNYLTNKPVQSMLIIAGAGVLLTLLLTRPKSKRNDYE